MFAISVDFLFSQSFRFGHLHFGCFRPRGSQNIGPKCKSARFGFLQEEEEIKEQPIERPKKKEIAAWPRNSFPEGLG